MNRRWARKTTIQETQTFWVYLLQRPIKFSSWVMGVSTLTIHRDGSLCCLLISVRMRIPRETKLGGFMGKGEAGKFFFIQK